MMHHGLIVKCKRRGCLCENSKTLRGRLGECIAKLYTSLSYYWEWISTGDYETIKKKDKKIESKEKVRND